MWPWQKEATRWAILVVAGLCLLTLLAVVEDGTIVTSPRPSRPMKSANKPESTRWPPQPMAPRTPPPLGGNQTSSVYSSVDEAFADLYAMALAQEPKKNPDEDSLLDRARLLVFSERQKYVALGANMSCK